MSKANFSLILGPAEMMLQVLAERRCALYERVATRILDAEDALDRGDTAAAGQAVDAIRREVRSALAYVTDEVFEEIEHLEALPIGSPGAKLDSRVPKEGSDESLVTDVRDHLTLLHVKLARSLRAPFLQDVEEVLGLPPRLKRKLEASRTAFAERVQQRESEEKAWELEREAREALAAGKPRRAIKSLKRAIKLAPEKAVFHNDLGYVYSSLGWFDEAVGEYDTAIEINEQHPQNRTEEWTTTYFNLGVARRKAALKVLESFADSEAGIDDPSLDKVNDLLASANAAFQSYLKTTPLGANVDRTRELVASIDLTLQELQSIKDERAAKESAA